MNSYQLIFKLIKVRADTYLTPADQALFHELVALCNEQRWKDVFFCPKQRVVRQLEHVGQHLAEIKESPCRRQSLVLRD